MRARAVVVTVALATVACGAFLPSSGDDAEPNGGSSSSSSGDSAPPENVPVDPNVGDPGSPPPDAAADADEKDANTPPPSGGGTWQCVTKTYGPFAKLTFCEAARNGHCQPPRSDVIDGKACPTLQEEHVSCGPCDTEFSFNAKGCTCR